MGIQDQKTSQQLQLDPDLTVEKAKKTIRQKEAVREQGQELEVEKRRGESLEELEKTVAELQTSFGRVLFWTSSERDPGVATPVAIEVMVEIGVVDPVAGPGRPQPATDVATTNTKGVRGTQQRKPHANRCNKRSHFRSRCLSKVPSQADVDFAFLDAVSNKSSRMAASFWEKNRWNSRYHSDGHHGGNL